MKNSSRVADSQAAAAAAPIFLSGMSTSLPVSMPPPDDAYARLRDAGYLLQTTRDTLTQLAALFRALERGADRPRDLAGLGQYVADDWASTCSAEETKITLFLAVPRFEGAP